MNILYIGFLFLSALCAADAFAVREVSGYVGGNISIQCSGQWNTAESQSYFCKSLCSSDDVLIETAGTWANATQKGRYVMERSGVDGAFTVTVMKLENTDTGRYHCASTRMSEVMYQETYHLKVLDALTVPAAPPSSTMAPVTVTELMPRDNNPSTVKAPVTVVTPPPHGGHKWNQDAATHITGTMVVIIISVSLALLVCALIPVIFYGRWRSTKGLSLPDTEKGRRAEAGYKENNEEQEMGSRPGAEHMNPGPADVTEYAFIYQGLDPKSLE